MPIPLSPLALGKLSAGFWGCDHQESYSRIPIRGEHFRGSVSVIEPKTDHHGLRASRDVARQISARLAEMEQEYFDDRK